MAIRYAETSATLSHLPFNAALSLIRILSSSTDTKDNEQYSYSSIILAFSALECFINEILQLTIFDLDPLNKQNLKSELAPIIKHIKNKYKKFDSTKSHDIINKFIEGFNASIKLKVINDNYLRVKIEEQDFWDELKFLIKLRNELIHHKMKSMDTSFNDFESVIRSIYTFYNSSTTPISFGWPSQYLSIEGAQFAIKTTQKVVKFLNNIELNSKERDFGSCFINKIKKSASNFISDNLNQVYCVNQADF